MDIRVDLRSVAQRRILVEVAVDREPGEVEDLEFLMPVWTPGSYLVREYPRHLSDVTALDGTAGTALNLEKTRKNRYRVRVAAHTVRVLLRYQVYAHSLTVREAWVGSEFAYWNGACVYLWPVGREGESARLTVSLPDRWELYSAAPPGDGEAVAGAAVVRLDGLDAAVDTPLLAAPNADVLAFEAAGKPHRIVCVGLAGVQPPESLVPDARAVIEQAAKVFIDGELPFEEYTFLALFGGTGRGGLEHRDSSTLLAPRTTFVPRRDYEDFVALIAHEFLHVWNGKRMAPRELARFDYERENYTRLLWVVEGVTSYYDDHVCLRAGIVDARTYLEAIARHIRNAFSMPGRFAQSLSEASFDAWIRFYRPDENTRNTTQNYYTNGALASMVLDARIRDLTDGERSLDDAMKSLYAATHAEGYDLTAVIDSLSEAASHDLSAEVRDLVEGPFDPDLEAALAVYGLELRWQADEDPYLGLQFKGGTLRIATVLDGTPAWRAGLAPDDEILAVASLRVTSTNWSQVLGQVASVDSPLDVLVDRDGRVLTLRPTPEQRKRARVEIRSQSRPTERQLSLREQWLGVTSRSLT